MDQKDADPARLLAIIATQAEEIALLRAQVAELTARLGQTSTNSSRPPSSDPPQMSRPPSKPSGRQPGGQPGHPGRFRALLAAAQVDEVIVCRPAACADCGAALAEAAGPTDPADERRQVWEVPPVAVVVTEYRLAARRCGACGHTTRASQPTGAGANGCGPRLTAVSATLSGRYRLSKRETVACLGDVFGVELSVGTVSALEQTVSAALEPVVTEAQVAVQQAAVVNMDETGWREARRRAWLWTAVTATLTIFHVNTSRGGAVARALLGAAWSGVVGSDRGTMYSWVDRQRRQVCWAHLKRDFQKLVDWGPASRPIGQRLLEVEAQVFALWHRFRRTEIDRATLVQDLIPIQAAMWQTLIEGSDGPTGKAAGVCSELQRLWPALWTFAHMEGVEPTNNVAERALRPAVLWRKGSFGTHSTAGSRFAERMLTVSATCRQQDRPLLDFLVATLNAQRLDTPPPSLVTATG